MNRSRTALLAALMIVALLVPVMAQEQEEPPAVVPAPLPFGPDNSTFYIFGSKPATVVGTQCYQALQDVHGTGLGNDGHPFAINNPADPCRVAEQPTGGNFERTIHQVAQGVAAFNVYVLPVVPDDWQMVAGEPIDGQVTLYFVPFNNNAAYLSAGQIKPSITLTIGDKTFGPWDEAPDLDPATIENDPAGERIYKTFQFSFGAATDEALSGPARLTISFANDAANQQLRFLGTRVGIAVDAGHQGFLNLPFEAPPPPPPVIIEPPVDENVTDNETGNETDNETTPPPTPTNSTVPDNGTVEEKGFLPGFEAVAVVSAGLLAAVFVSLGRRGGAPPPPTRSKR